MRALRSITHHSARFATDAEHIGAPTDPNEAERVEWVPVVDLRGLIADGQVTDGFSLTALGVAFTLGHLR